MLLCPFIICASDNGFDTPLEETLSPEAKALLQNKQRFENAIRTNDVQAVRDMILNGIVAHGVIDAYLEGTTHPLPFPVSVAMQFYLTALRDRRLYKKPLKVAAEDDAWCRRMINPGKTYAVWFENVDADTFRMNWKKDSDDVSKQYETSEGECWLLKYLIEDKVAGGLDRLKFDPKATFGPGKEQAITLAVLGNRTKCVDYLLERGDADDFLDWLLKIAETKKRVPAIQGLIKKRITAIQSDKTEVPSC